MAEQKFPTGDDRHQARRKTGTYFTLPSELAEQFRRSEQRLKSPDRGDKDQLEDDK
ncbi:hypothetical protein GCM10011581_07040 [Saccharopolyspora subtropica]|uniref:Uncharacterized protein n=1 Tax=Saccharopolyspora thermophila TaxID=89367 RepID=A0A917JMW9_9PSEU|nr:hypothetical protein [Saccharopolyspora subtropica]GGI72677.1 hypothetical protein GCM10011581_07040 [Saccharopolyspora subtropica]